MRIKEDLMKNGQIKPAYNLQIATCNQFVLGYDVFQNPTDTKTLKPLLEKIKIAQKLPHYLVADAGWGSQSNYLHLEDELPQHTALISYGKMFKEQSKKWQTDDRKVMNWVYKPKEVFDIDVKRDSEKDHCKSILGVP